jgi:hypothetical protein
MPFARRQPTVMFPLPGGQNRLKQMILYVAGRCEGARFFGAIKLNKILWKADFDSFLESGTPVTGREYRRQKFGPALREMMPVQREMLGDGTIRIERRDFGDGIVELRTIAVDGPSLSIFSERDLWYVERSISHYWDMTGMESSDESHGVAWLTRANGDPMPYEVSILSDRQPTPDQMKRLKSLIGRREMTTQ